MTRSETLKTVAFEPVARITELLERHAPPNLSNLEMFSRIGLLAAHNSGLVHKYIIDGSYRSPHDPKNGDISFQARIDLGAVEKAGKKLLKPALVITTRKGSFAPEDDDRGQHLHYRNSPGIGVDMSTLPVFDGGSDGEKLHADFSRLDRIEDVKLRELYLRHLAIVMSALFDPLKPLPKL